MRRLPLDYAVRNLGRSPVRLAMSVFGSALVVILATSAFAFVRGMDQSLAQSGSPDNVMLLGAGSEESIERSEVNASVPGQAQASIWGIRRQAGQDFVSPEVHMALGVSFEPDQEPIGQAVFRGVTPTAFPVHPQVQMLEGRVFDPGSDEIIVGELAATRLGVSNDQLALGRSLWIDGRQYTIVGRFAAPNTVMNAEIWIPLANLQILTRRDSLSCIVITMGKGELADADVFVKSRVDLELAVIRETEYYSKLSDFYKPVKMMVWVTALLIGIGGLLGGLNTMYAAFASRVREVGMLQSLGYPRRAVMLSFVQESLIAASAGGLIGSSVCLLLLDGVAIQFSMGAFGLILDGPTIFFGIASGLMLGLVGSLPPTLRCLRMSIAQTLKAA